MYVRIFLAARYHLRRINPQTENTPQQHYIKRELKAAVTPCIVLGVMFICWIPQIIVMGMTRHELSAFRERFVADAFLLINSTINPLIYACHSKEFRQAFCKIIQKAKVKLIT